jgi:hypothetical protein
MLRFEIGKSRVKNKLPIHLKSDEMATQKKDDKLEPQIGELWLDVARQTPKSLIACPFLEKNMQRTP